MTLTCKATKAAVMESHIGRQQLIGAMLVAKLPGIAAPEAL